MKLIDKPHCKKHEVYEQKCIGCRIKAQQKKQPEFGRLKDFGTPVEAELFQ
jgi:hypothetical protein